MVFIEKSSHQGEGKTFVTMSEDNEEKRIHQPSARIIGRVSKRCLGGGRLVSLGLGVLGLAL
jgi:hypothetical protein